MIKIVNMNCKEFSHKQIKNYTYYDSINLNKIKIPELLLEDLACNTDFTTFIKNEFSYEIYKHSTARFKLTGILFEGTVGDFGHGFFFQLNSFDNNGTFIDAVMLMANYSWEVEYVSEFEIMENCLINIINYAKFLASDAPGNGSNIESDFVLLKKSTYQISEEGVFIKISEEIIKE